MNDKSPRQQLSAKSGKSLKQKRADKQAKDTEAVPSVAALRKGRNGH